MVRSTTERALFDESTNEAIRSALPDLAVAFFEVATHAGDGVTLMAIAALLYWFGGEENRRTRALVIAIALGALAIVAGIKGIVAAPRPELAFTPSGYPGYSFPSAHALGAAAVYGSLARVGTIGTKRLRYAVAGSLIALVSFSRVVLGLHYLGDVLVGVILGLLWVALVLRWEEIDPRAVFSLAGAIAIVAFLLGSVEYTTMTIGAAIGAVAAWTYLERGSWNPTGASLLVLGVLCLPLLFGLRAAAFLGETTWIVEIAGYALLTGAALLVPVVAARLDDFTHVKRLQSRLPFDHRTLDAEQLPGDDTAEKMRSRSR